MVKKQETKVAIENKDYSDPFSKVTTMVDPKSRVLLGKGEIQ